MTSGIMPRLTPKTAMWLWLIFGAIFGAFGLSTFVAAIGRAGLTQTVRFIVGGGFLMVSAVYFRNAWAAYRDSRNPKE